MTLDSHERNSNKITGKFWVASFLLNCGKRVDLENENYWERAESVRENFFIFSLEISSGNPPQ
jgi:hypothetical protein